MRLFSDLSRHDPSSASHQESTYDFLDRVDSPYWAEVRHLLESWFSYFPLENQADLRARFQSSDQQQHVPAFWELYLHELFTRLGYRIQIHPELPSVATRPDMLVERENESFYVEAVTLVDTDTAHRSNRKRAQVYDAINKRVRSSQFFVDVETIVEGKHTPPLRLICRDLDEWLLSLEADKVLALSPPEQSWVLPENEVAYGGWKFRFRAIPNPKDRRISNGPTVGMFSPPRAVCVSDHLDLIDRMEGKSKKYGELDRPLVIAVLYARLTARDYHLLRALFGEGWESSEMLRQGRIDSNLPAHFDGLWLTRKGPRNRYGSAVLCGLQLAPFSIARSGLWLLHHPWAQVPLTASLPFASMRIDDLTGEAIAAPATRTPYDIFNLPSSWPPGEPFLNNNYMIKMSINRETPLACNRCVDSSEDDSLLR